MSPSLPTAYILNVRNDCSCKRTAEEVIYLLYYSKFLLIVNTLCEKDIEQQSKHLNVMLNRFLCVLYVKEITKWKNKSVQSKCRFESSMILV